MAKSVQTYPPKSRVGTVLEYAKSNLIAPDLHWRELAAVRATE
jgi:hypothetical protein